MNALTEASQAWRAMLRAEANIARLQAFTHRNRSMTADLMASMRDAAQARATLNRLLNPSHVAAEAVPA